MIETPFIAHSELTNEIYIVVGKEKYRVTEQAIKAVKAIKALEQEPTTKNDLGVDCISREQALVAIRNLYPGMPRVDFNGSLRKWVDKYKPYIECDDAIEQLSSVTPQEPKWITVSERLPKTYEFVNCTCHSLIDDREDWVVETCYIPQPHNSPYSDWGNIPMLNSCECEVIAWMHRDIPKPYKAESEEE